MHKRFTTMQLNTVEIWKGSSRMKSPGKKTNSRSLATEILFVLLDLEQWNKKLETHQSLIDIHACVSRKLNSCCNYAHRKNRKKHRNMRNPWQPNSGEKGLPHINRKSYPPLFGSVFTDLPQHPKSQQNISEIIFRLDLNFRTLGIKSQTTWSS